MIIFAIIFLKEGDGQEMFSEKRKYARIDFDCEILYPTITYMDKKNTLTEGTYHLYTLDISEAGICLQSNFPILKDSFVSFYLRIEDNLPFRIFIKILWDSQDEGNYISGGEFIALNQEDINILRKYVNIKQVI